MIKQIKIAGLRYIIIFWLQKYFNSVQTLSHRSQLWPTIKQFFTHFSKKKKKIDYFKWLLMTHHLDIFMSGKKLGLNGLTVSQWSKVIANKLKRMPVVTYVFDSGLLGALPIRHCTAHFCGKAAVNAVCLWVHWCVCILSIVKKIIIIK